MTEQDQTGQTLADDVTQVVSNPAPLEPVTPPEGPPKRSRGRWAVALGGAAIVVAITAAVVVALVGKSPNASVLGYVPGGSVLYGELRMDLPGNQGKQVAAFLSKFPGFADQAAFETKIDEALDRLIAQATSDKQTFTKDIKPWFEGELAFSVGALPEASSLTDPSDMSGFHGLALLSIKDATLAQAWFTNVLTESGAKTTSETYNGTAITVSGESGGVQAGLAIIDGKVAVIGDLASVKAAIDTKGAGAFANEAGPKAAFAASDSDHLGLLYMDINAFYDWSASVSSAMTSSMGADPTGLFGDCDLAAMNAAMTDYLPSWATFLVKAEADAIVLETVSPSPTTTMGSTTDRASTIAKRVPASTLFFAEGHDVGASLTQILDFYKQQACFKDAIDQLESAADLAGGLDAVIGWMGDAAIVIDGTDPLPSVGLVVVPTDSSDAAQLLTSLKGVIDLAGAEQGVTIREEDRNGTTITIVSAGSITDRIGQMGGTVPPGVDLPSGDIELAWAVTDDLVVVGSGPGFVANVLDTTEATSLASDDRFASLAKRVGDGTGITFIDLTAIRERTEGLIRTMEPSALATYERDVKPYLEPFDAIIASASVGGDPDRSEVLITVK